MLTTSLQMSVGICLLLVTTIMLFPTPSMMIQATTTDGRRRTRGGSSESSSSSFSREKFLLKGSSSSSFSSKEEPKVRRLQQRRLPKQKLGLGGGRRGRRPGGGNRGQDEDPCQSHLDCPSSYWQYCAQGICRRHGRCNDDLDCINPSNQYYQPPVTGCSAAASSFRGDDTLLFCASDGYCETTCRTTTTSPCSSEEEGGAEADDTSPPPVVNCDTSPCDTMPSDECQNENPVWCIAQYDCRSSCYTALYLNAAGSKVCTTTTGGGEEKTVTFFATGGRFVGERRVTLPEQLTTLPTNWNEDDATVLFHLGDWNSPFATSCNELSYQENMELFSNSAVPVYFVPGDNEYNDCPNPEQALTFWYEYNLEFETKFWPEPQYWNVTRQQEPNYPENFYYIYNGILFIGINLVGGFVHDVEEWESRHIANLQWIDDLYKQYQPTGDIQVMVILAHSDLDRQANDGFFTTFLSRVENDYADNNMLTVFIHRNLGTQQWGLERQFNGIDNLIVVVVEGSIWPPMMIQIKPKAGIVNIDQNEWYESYLNSTLTL